MLPIHYFYVTHRFAIIRLTLTGWQPPWDSAVRGMMVRKTQEFKKAEVGLTAIDAHYIAALTSR